MSFVFLLSPHFVNQGAEKANRLPDADTAEDIAALRKYHPELAEWGDAALDIAWGSYCQQVNMISWEPVSERDEDFLNFCCCEQTRGEFAWGDYRAKLCQANEWKS
ncbi:hypothetical protein ACFQDN_21725 [Pseudomonas asuensis]|uniref:Uncharacterized protein n=1 Tax=Pseudomonas asuensis TaxID=1825787 RepID=A0ABQ2H2T3_9PSED|nr:hypothetical protein [Pseudomonas asuensis]GGM25093.1 hypothetical protein GCM10009425_39910 [Pseudomonas asuensis]